MSISKSQLDQLGDRIRRGNNSEEDFRQLEEYRSTFTQAHEKVASTIRGELSLEPSKRAKTMKSIADKLLRESIRLTQIQDIAGCRVVVSNVSEQESVVESLKRLFEKATIVDRRERPSHGYRAVHVIVNMENKLVEVQVRTLLQNVWAELSEKLSDATGSAIKYGQGDEVILMRLGEISFEIAKLEAVEADLDRISENIRSEEEKRKFNEAKKRHDGRREFIFTTLRTLIGECKKLEEEGNDIFN